MNVSFFTKDQLAWFNQDKKTALGLPAFIEELEHQNRSFSLGNEKEGTELKCHLFVLGLVAGIALACGSGLLISQIDGGLYPAVCLLGISVGFVVGMVIAYYLSRGKQKTLQQSFENYQKEKVSIEQLLPILEQSDETTVRSVLDRHPEKKTVIHQMIDHYTKPNLTQEQLKLVSILKIALLDIPLLSEQEKTELPKFLADYENRIFDLHQSPADLHDPFIARIYYLSQQTEWVKSNKGNAETAKRYFQLFVIVGEGLDIFLDTLMEKFPDFLIPCTVQYQGMPAKIPILRMITLSPIFADMFEELGNTPDMVIPLDEAYQCSKDTVPLFFDYLKYGKIGTFPPIEHAKLAQCFQLDDFAKKCDLSNVDFSATLKMAIQEGLYDIQWQALFGLMEQPEKAKSLKEPNAEKLNQFIDHAIQLEKSGPTLSYIPSTKKIQESPLFGRYFSLMPAQRIWKIDDTLSMYELNWLKKKTDCEWDACTSTRALEQCYLCIRCDSTYLAKKFLNCAEKLLQKSEEKTPFGYNLEQLQGNLPVECATWANVESHVFSSIDSLLSLYQFAQANHATDVTKAILKFLQARKTGEDIIAILSAGQSINSYDWICVGLELMSRIDIRIVHQAGQRAKVPEPLWTYGFNVPFEGCRAKYQAGEFHVELPHLLSKTEQSIKVVIDLHTIVKITHIFAANEVLKAIGTRLDHLQITKVTLP